MKRIAILFIATILSTMVATAQTEVGKFSLKPVAGITISDLTEENDNSYNSKVGFTGGIEVEYGITPELGVSLGVLYAQQGGKYEKTNDTRNPVNGETLASETTKYKAKVDYINLPLLANFYVGRGFAIKAGVQMGILVNDKWTYSYANDFNFIIGEPYHIPGQDDGIHKNGKMTDFGKSIDFGIPVGLSYEYHDFIVDARYYFGLTKIDSPNFGSNRCLSITLGYKFKL